MSMSHLVKSYKTVCLNDCVQHRTSGANEPNIRYKNNLYSGW